MSSCLGALGSWRTVLYRSSVPSANAQKNINTPQAAFLHLFLLVPKASWSSLLESPVPTNL